MDRSRKLTRDERHQRLARLMGEAIRRERHLLQMTQEQLADAAEITTESLGRVERGEGVVAYPRLFDILYALDLSDAACIDILRQDADLRRAAA